MEQSFDSFLDNFFAKPDEDLISQNKHDNLYTKDLEIQKSNILHLLKLVIKELFKHRSKVTLTKECKIFFDHLFILLEKVLLHGLRQKKQMFGKVDSWTVLESLEKMDSNPEIKEINEIIRHLPKIRTSLGRTRAWFRLVTMRKKLSDYVQIFFNNRHILQQHYDPIALMLSEDMNLVCGLLIGLNSFNYDVFIKDSNFDAYPTFVDMKYYLRECILEDNGHEDQDGSEDNQETSLMDQLAYSEEINLHLRSTIKDLEDKLAAANVQQAQTPEKTLMDVGTIIVNKEKQLVEAEKRIEQLENQIRLQVKEQEDSHTEVMTLTTDIKEKEETLLGLRSQLDKIKEINIQMFNKLKEKDVEIKDKNEKLAESETQMALLRKEVKRLEKRLKQQGEDKQSKELLDNYQKLIDEQQEQMTTMKLQIETLRQQMGSSHNLKEAHNLLKKKYDENELALEEIGKQLQDAKLEMESLREYNGHLNDASWISDSIVNRCKQCTREFTFARRKHHCRCCGCIYCNHCSSNEMPLPSSHKKVRVCDNCYAYLLERYNNNNSSSTSSQN